MSFLKRNLTCLIVSLLFLSTWAGCGSGGGSGGTTGTTNLQGTVALNDGTVGTLAVTIQSAVATTSSFSLIRAAEAQTTNTVPATGDCVTPTCTINLSGDYNTSTGSLNISGSGGTGAGCSNTTTIFAGTVSTGSGGGMSGTIQDSSGTQTGGFSGVFTTSGNAASTYCGIAVGGDTDAFNVNVDAQGNLTGTAQPIPPSTENGVSFKGTVNQSTNTFTACSDDPTGSKPICGEIQSDGTVIGKFQMGSGAEGCFVGNATVCTTGTLPAPCSGPTATCTYPTCP